MYSGFPILDVFAKAITQFIPTLNGLIGAIIGAVIGAWATFRVSKVQDYNHAAAAFKEKLQLLSSLIKNLSPTEKELYELLRQEFTELQKVKNSFEWHLSNKDLNKLNKDWETFLIGKNEFHKKCLNNPLTKNHCSGLYFYYVLECDSSRKGSEVIIREDNPQEKTALVIEHIENLSNPIKFKNYIS